MLEEVKKDKTISMKDLLNEKYNTDLGRYHISRIVRDNVKTNRLSLDGCLNMQRCKTYGRN